MFKVPEQYRLQSGIFATDQWDGRNGMFVIPNPFTRNNKPELQVMSSDGKGWEHVSVSLRFRSPTWEEMCKVRLLFWDDNDVVIQYHPAKNNYVNNHPYCLHLWRPVGIELLKPPEDLVGFKNLNPDEMRRLAKLFVEFVQIPCAS